MPHRTTRGIKQDRARRSAQGWERGKKAKKIGNPRYKPVSVMTKHGSMKKVYKLRNLK